MADQGFTAFEDNGMMRRTPELQQQMGDLMAKLGIAMGVFVIQTGGNNSDNFTSGKPEDAGNFVKACTAAVDVAKRCNAKWMTVVPGNFDRRLPIDMQTAHVVDTLRAGADVLAKANLVMVLEPLADTPDLFLRLRVAGLHDLPRREQRRPARSCSTCTTRSATRGTSSATST